MPPTMMKLGLVFMGDPYRGAAEWVVRGSRQGKELGARSRVAPVPPTEDVVNYVPRHRRLVQAITAGLTIGETVIVKRK